MEKREMRLSYDKVADVLYISFGKPSFGIDEESEPGIFIRYIFDQTFHFFKKWNVYTPIDFEKRFSQKIEETLPITFEEINPIFIRTSEHEK